MKSVAGLGKNSAIALIAFDQEEKSKVIMFTDKGHYRIFDNAHVNLTSRLGKVQSIMPCFKSDVHHIVNAFKLNNKQDLLKINLFLNNDTYYTFDLDNFYLTDLDKYAKKNIDISAKDRVVDVTDATIEIVNKNTISHPIIVKEKRISLTDEGEESEEIIDTEPVKEEKEGFEQISIFDDLDE